MISSPCKGCEERKLHCHSTCEKYSEFRARMDEYHREKAKQTAIEVATTESIMRLRKHAKRGKNG